MRIKNRLTPYPILDNYGDDYIDSSFDCEIELTTQFTEVYGKIVYNLDNKEIENLISKGDAEFVAHIECPSTSYRIKIESKESKIEFKLSSADVAKTLEIRTFIVLLNDIKDFESVNFHPDYEGKKFNISKHQILAVGTGVDYTIGVDETDLESLPSVLQIYEMKDTRKGSLNVNTDNDKYVIIGLASEVYQLYANLGKSTFKSTAFSLVLLPALIIILQRMYENRNDDDFNSRHWFQVINTYLEKNNCKLDEVKIENDSLLITCQAVFADPILRSFKELESCSERMV